MMKKGKRRHSNKFESCDQQTEIVKLRQHLHRHGFKPTIDLRLRNFATTGRGVCSIDKVKEGSNLIEISFNLMISFCTVAKSNIYALIPNKNLLSVQDYIALFLTVERSKKQKSDWKWYIDTLPVEIPSLPWLCDAKLLNLLPTEAKEYILKHKNLFENSWDRVKTILNEINLNKDDYCWAYAMVNTRSVHVDPKIVQSITKNGLNLNGEPNMALCPYLDMFNHSDLAMTSANLEKSDNYYTFILTTHKSYKAHEQIFISYGQRDNLTLFCDYGFFTKTLYNEKIILTFEEIAKKGKFLVTTQQRNFIKKHNFVDDIKVFIEGISFNLKALLFVLMHAELEYSWSNVIFTECYSKETLFNMYNLVSDILFDKLVQLQKEYEFVIGNYRGECSRFETVIDFVKSRVEFCKGFIDICKQEIKNNTL